MEPPRWIEKLEHSLEEWSIPYLIRGLIGLNLVAWLLNGFSPSFVGTLSLNPDLVLQGEFWRIITFLFIPAINNSTLSPIFMLFFVFFTWFISDLLEDTWGSFKITLYFIIGVITINLAAFIVPTIGTNYYLFQSLVCCAAILYPNLEITLFPIPIPIKLKWLGIFYGFLIALYFLGNPVMVFASLLPFLLFVGPGSIQLIRQRRDAKARMKRFRGED